MVLGRLLPTIVSSFLRVLKGIKFGTVIKFRLLICYQSSKNSMVNLVLVKFLRTSAENYGFLALVISS